MHLRRYSQHDVPALLAIQRACFPPPCPQEQLWSPEQLLSQINTFPEGCLCVNGTRASCEYIVNGKYLATDVGLPPATGQVYNLPGGIFFEIQENKILRVTDCYNLEDWLKLISE